MRRRTALLIAGLALAASGASASAAAAFAPPNPHFGNVGGACNMLNPAAAPHMLGNPVQSGPGLAGMFRAISNTTGIPDGGCLG
jgi:hypothetical protein